MQEDDLYSGYDDGHPHTMPAGGRSSFQTMEHSSSSRGRAGLPPGTASTRLGTAMRPGTGGADGVARPMTSNRGAGFSSNPRSRLDGQKGAVGAGGSILPKKQEPSAEEVARVAEKRVHELLEASVELGQQGSTQAALEKALEARKKERALAKARDAAGAGDGHPPELGFAVDVQLAGCYAASRLWAEALELYGALVKNARGLPLPAERFRTNMGNVHFAQGKFPAAIKQYRMALDALPPSAGPQRARLLANIGLAFVELGQHADAAGTFGAAADLAPDHQAAFNLLVCCHALGDQEGMMGAFQRLLGVPALAEAKALQEEEEEAGEAAAARRAAGGHGGLRDSIVGLVWLRGQDGGAGGSAGDQLKQQRARQLTGVKRCVLTAAQLLSEGLTDRGGFAAGFDWAVEQLRQAGHDTLAAEVLLAKASRLLAAKQVDAAMEVYKALERRGASAIPAVAATNLSFLYLLEGDLPVAARYTDLALKADRYNAQAHVNRGVVLLEAGSLEEALAAFSDAAAIQPLCVQALYNLGVVNLRLGDPEAALQPLKKLHGLLPDQPEVVHCLALAADMSGDSAAAVRWLEVLTSLVPHDPGVLCKLGAIFHRLGEAGRSTGYYQDAHRVWPVNLDVISWLGAAHVRSEVYERALPYFELAAAIQPQEAKWALMVASCYRRVGAYGQALERYRAIAAAHPTNCEALRYLVALCQQGGHDADADRFGHLLRRAEAAEAAAAAAAAAGHEHGQPPQGSSGDEGDSAGHHQHADGPEVPAPQYGGSLESHLASKARRPGAGSAGAAAARAGADDWGEELLGDDMLPL